VEDDGVGDKKLLVARSNKRCGNQRIKNIMEVPAGKLKLSEVSEKP